MPCNCPMNFLMLVLVLLLCVNVVTCRTCFAGSRLDYQGRRDLFLDIAAGSGLTDPNYISNPEQDIYSNRAIANLYLGRFIEAANKKIRRTTEWYDHPHPRGLDHRGEPDFAAIKLCVAYHLFKDTEKLEPETIESIKHFFFTQRLDSMYSSENHMLLYRTSRYLMAQEFPDQNFEYYKKRGREILEEDGAWLRRYILYRAKYAWGEFDSSNYMGVDLECLLVLYDYCADRVLREHARMMADLLIADMLVDSLNGMYGGAHGRIYTNPATDHGLSCGPGLHYLYFGIGNPEDFRIKTTSVPILTSSYRPLEILRELATERTTPYENLERKHLHNLHDLDQVDPIEGSIRKYTYWTPSYVLGCVQYQDDYPEGHSSAWYAHHQQHEWDLSFGTKMKAKIFTHHPGDGGTHNYWTGDTRCNCGDFFQHKNALVALYDIPPKESHQYIHAYVPREVFDEVIEEDGCIFIREGEAYAALKIVNGYRWSEDNSDFEIIGDGAKQAVVCEVGLVPDYESFERFRESIKNNTISFNKEKMELIYDSASVGRLRINTKGLRELNGEAVDLGYPKYGCPYLHSEWGSSKVRVTFNEKVVDLDFGELSTE